MDETLKSKKESVTREQVERLATMQRLRQEWLAQRAKRVRIVQELHC